MSLRLQSSVEERDEAVKEKNRVLASLSEKEREIMLLSKEIKDRSRQVQILLREQFVLKGGHHSAAPEVGMAADDTQGADQVISQRLVAFRNIEELQAQNANLLRSIRSLATKMEEQENEKSSTMESAKLESIQETTGIIEQLKEQLQRERNNAEVYRKERNTWKSMAENRAGNVEVRVTSEKTSGEHDCEYKVKLGEIKEDFEIYKKESTANNKKLQSKLQQSTEENSAFSMQVSNLKNQISYLNGNFYN